VILRARRFLFLIFAAAAVGSIFFVSHAEAATWYNPAWGYRNLLSVNASQVSTSSITSSTYVNFTALVSLASSTQLKNGAKATGTDILFTDSDGATLLNFEIENYASSTGELEAWVKLPQVATSSNTQFYIYYGNAAATTSLQSATNTWANSYSAVWHLNQTGNGTLGEYKDSTKNANNGRGGNGSSSATPTRVAGKVSYGQQFNASTFIYATGTTGIAAVNATQTIAFWFEATSTITTTENFLSLVNAAASSSNQAELRSSRLALTQWGGSFTVSSTQPTSSAWHFYTVTLTPGYNSLYVDGALVGTSTIALQTGATAYAVFGSYDTTPSEAYTGYLDETELSTTALPAAWIKTEYNNQNSPGTFITVAAQETPPAFTQSAYRWFTNMASTSVGSPLAAQNTTTTAQLVNGSAFRLRLLVRVTGSVLNTGGQSFNLQYVDAGTGSCASPSGGTPATYTNVSTLSGDFYFLNNGIADGGALVATSTDPVDGANTVNNETYEQSNPFTNSQSAIAAGADGKWDFALQTGGATVGATYCFRAAIASGTAFSSYAVYPTAVIGNVAPTVGAVTLNGNNDIILNIATTSLIQATATVSDGNGYTDIATTSAVIFRTSSGTNCTANNNDCYIVSSCSLSLCAGTSCTATCGANVWYFAQPTDAGSPWSGDSWSAAVTAKDASNATSTATSTGVDLLSLLGIQVPSSINYGSLSPGSTTATLNTPVAVSSVGNVSMNVTLYGTNMTNGSYSIPVGNQSYATSILSFASGTSLLASPGTTVMLAIPKTTSTVPASKTLDWGISVPNPQPSGNFTGANTFIGVENSLPWP